MTITRPAPATVLPHQPLKTLYRWAKTLTWGPRARRPRPRTALGHPSAPPPTVWTLDRTELTSALEHSRW